MQALYDIKQVFKGDVARLSIVYCCFCCPYTKLHCVQTTLLV